jgi:hypothetical protein
MENCTLDNGTIKLTKNKEKELNTSQINIITTVILIKEKGMVKASFYKYAVVNIKVHFKKVIKTVREDISIFKITQNTKDNG